MMDINTIRIAVTVISFVAFIGILLWAYSGGARKSFDEAALLPFSDDRDDPDAARGARR
jgi:cytochrome c oxidase cbb3-type subunit 4